MIFDFALVKRSVQGLEEKLKSLRGQISALQQERQSVHAAPVAKEEVKALIGQWIGDAGKDYSAAFCAGVEAMSKNPSAFSRSNLVQRLASFGALGVMYGEEPSAQELGRGLCAMFGASIKDSLIKSIDAMQWPTNALTHAQREKQLAQLDGKIADLEREAIDIINKAAEVGINLE